MPIAWHAQALQSLNAHVASLAGPRIGLIEPLIRQWSSAPTDENAISQVGHRLQASGVDPDLLHRARQAWSIQFSRWRVEPGEQGQAYPGHQQRWDEENREIDTLHRTAVSQGLRLLATPELTMDIFPLIAERTPLLAAAEPSVLQSVLWGPIGLYRLEAPLENYPGPTGYFELMRDLSIAFNQTWTYRPRGARDKQVPTSSSQKKAWGKSYDESLFKRNGWEGVPSLRWSEALWYRSHMDLDPFQGPKGYMELRNQIPRKRRAYSEASIILGALLSPDEKIARFGDYRSAAQLEGRIRKNSQEAPIKNILSPGALPLAELLAEAELVKGEAGFEAFAVAHFAGSREKAIAYAQTKLSYREFVALEWPQESESRLTSDQTCDAVMVVGHLRNYWSSRFQELAAGSEELLTRDPMRHEKIAAAMELYLLRWMFGHEIKQQKVIAKLIALAVMENDGADLLNAPLLNAALTGRQIDSSFMKILSDRESASYSLYEDVSVLGNWLLAYGNFPADIPWKPWRHRRP